MIAAVTDGDVRRFILSGGSLQAEVKQFANYTPIYLKIDQVHLAKTKMRRYGIPAIPVVDADMHVLQIIYNEDKAAPIIPQVQLPVVINAGGKGTRLYPYTKILPKPLIPIGEQPITEIIINRFYDMGCRDFYMIVNHKKNMIKAYFNELDKPYSLTFVDEDTPLGTGGGLSLLQGMLKDTFVFANCDTIIDESFFDIYKTHKNSGNLITMIVALKQFHIPYGIVETGDNGCIKSLSEKPEMSFLTNTGCYLVEPQVVEDLTAGETVDFPTVIDRYRVKGAPVGVCPISEYAWLDMGQFDTMEEMRRRLHLDDEQ